MTVHHLWVEHYRSLRSVSVELGRVTVVTGRNGTGKSNLYRAVTLLAAAATGRLASTLLAEGGMPAALWAGRRPKGPVRMTLGVAIDEYAFELKLGVPQVPVTSPFVLDPEVKEERMWFGPKATRRTLIAERHSRTCEAVTAAGTRVRIATGLDLAESVLSQLSQPEDFPELFGLRQHLSRWRFYHHIDTGPASPLRRPQPGIRTTVLAGDGSDLAAALATIEDMGDGDALHRAVADAFGGRHLVVHAEQGTFGLALHQFELNREASAAELSDGTLRYLALVAALASPRPPDLLVLNEPETSLHADLFAPLAAQISHAAQHCQIWVTTHSEVLAAALASHPEAAVVDLDLDNGATVANRRAR